jgi:hypothetical protein
MVLKNQQKGSKIAEMPLQKQIRKQGSKFKLKTTEKASTGDQLEPGEPEEPEEQQEQQENQEQQEQQEKENSNLGKLDIKERFSPPPPEPLQEGVNKEDDRPQPEIAPPPEPLEDAVNRMLECHWFPLEKVIAAINYQGISGRRFI